MDVLHIISIFNSGCRKCHVCLKGKYHFCRKNFAVGVKRGEQRSILKGKHFYTYILSSFQQIPNWKMEDSQGYALCQVSVCQAS